MNHENETENEMFEPIGLETVPHQTPTYKPRTEHDYTPETWAELHNKNSNTPHQSLRQTEMQMQMDTYKAIHDAKTKHELDKISQDLSIFPKNRRDSMQEKINQRKLALQAQIDLNFKMAERRLKRRLKG